MAGAFQIRHGKMWLYFFILTAAIAGAHSPSLAQTSDLPVNCQVIVSLMELDEDAPGMEEKNYDLIFFGAAAQKPFYKDTLEYGFETGANLSMENDTNVLSYSAGSSGGTAKVAIDNTWFLFDYFGGGYVAANVASRLRLYAGAGPLLIYGSWEHDPDENDDEFDDDNESHLSAGVYGRAGIEVAIIDRLSIGGGVRAIATNLEFDDSLGEIKVEGPQYFFNISFKI
jgi:hypothetical protein